MSTPINAPITGTPYPTLSGKPGNVTFSNPPFHPNILNITSSYKAGNNNSVNPPIGSGFGYNSGGNLQRGRLLTDPIQTTDWNNKSLGTAAYQVNFLYNPSTITESRGVDLNSGVVPSAYRNVQDPSQYVTGMNSTIGFSLLFDRTFELWDSGYANTDAGKYGVRADVEALYNLVGINQGATTASPTGGVFVPTGGTTAAGQTITVQGVMTVVPCHLYFGATNQWSLNYYGYINSFNVTWTHFTSAMVPQRCAVDIQYTVLPSTTSTFANVPSTG